MSQIKEDLKSLALEIRALKLKRKEYRGYVPELTSKSHEYRHKHVAYCMLRGTPYESIEPKTREDNKIDMDWVEQLMEGFAHALVYSGE